MILKQNNTKSTKEVTHSPSIMREVTSQIQQDRLVLGTNLCLVSAFYLIIHNINRKFGLYPTNTNA